MEERFDDFIKERRYLKGVSQRTIDWYEDCFAAWRKHSEGGDYKRFIINLKEKGTSAISINTYICGMNAYFKWAEVPLKIGYLKEESKIIATLSANHISALLRFKATGTNLLRAHMVALVILDTGIRCSECLALQGEDFDFDTMTIKVFGKGGKYRLVPFSPELRKRIYRYCAGVKAYVFGTKHNTQVSLRNIERDFNTLSRKLAITGVRFSPHTLRHSFAVSYLRAGGNIFYLSKILGHSSVKVTEGYLKSIGVDDLTAVHSSLSPLARGRG